MRSSIGLRTRGQFLALNERKVKWAASKDTPAGQARFAELTGPRWAQENCALDEIDAPALWLEETPDARRAELLARHIQAAQYLLGCAVEQEHLAVENLLEIHRRLMRDSFGSGRFRELDIQPLAEGHEPIEGRMVPDVVENALEWFTSDSFDEMHEVERMALALIKLIDIHPFEAGNGKTLRLGSNFFLLKAGFPPAIIASSKASQYAIAIQDALRFNTQPLVDLLTDAALQSLSFCLDELAAPPAMRVLQ